MDLKSVIQVLVNETLHFSENFSIYGDILRGQPLLQQDGTFAKSATVRVVQGCPQKYVVVALQGNLHLVAATQEVTDGYFEYQSVANSSLSWTLFSMGSLPGTIAEINAQILYRLPAGSSFSTYLVAPIPQYLDAAGTRLTPTSVEFVKRPVPAGLDTSGINLVDVGGVLCVTVPTVAYVGGSVVLHLSLASGVLDGEVYVVDNTGRTSTVFNPLSGGAENFLVFAINTGLFAAPFYSKKPQLESGKKHSGYSDFVFGMEQNGELLRMDYLTRAPVWTPQVMEVVKDPTTEVLLPFGAQQMTVDMAYVAGCVPLQLQKLTSADVESTHPGIASAGLYIDTDGFASPLCDQFLYDRCATSQSRAALETLVQNPVSDLVPKLCPCFTQEVVNSGLLDAAKAIGQLMSDIPLLCFVDPCFGGLVKRTSMNESCKTEANNLVVCTSVTGDMKDSSAFVNQTCGSGGDGGGGGGGGGTTDTGDDTLLYVLVATGAVVVVSVAVLIAFKFKKTR